MRSNALAYFAAFGDRIPRVRLNNLSQSTKFEFQQLTFIAITAEPKYCQLTTDRLPTDFLGRFILAKILTRGCDSGLALATRSPLFPLLQAHPKSNAICKTRMGSSKRSLISVLTSLYAQASALVVAPPPDGISDSSIAAAIAP